MAPDSDDSVTEAVLRLEAKRCEAVNTHQMETLSELLAADYVHVHSNGAIETKQDCVEGFRRTRRAISRGNLSVRVYGDVAIMIGPQPVVLETATGPLRLKLMVTQVARLDEGEWRFVSFHSCPLPAETAGEGQDDD
jgi:hypothetical protein